MKGPYMRGALVGTVPLLLTGCIGGGSRSGALTFSPDGKKVCYLREDRLEEKVVDGKIWLRWISLHWCCTREPTKESSVHIGVLGAEYGSYSLFLGEAKWSRQGALIGVRTPHKLTIVETKSGRKIRISDGTITSFAWSSDKEIAYLTSRAEKNRRRIVICRFDVGTLQRNDVFAFPERPKIFSIGSGYWSPSGKFLIFMEPDGSRQYHCVNVSDGTVRAFGQTGAHDVGVAWLADSSRAFCVSEKIGPEEIYEALLVDPVTGATVDCTAGFQDTFAGHSPRLEPIWTVDGRYVLVNALHINGHLVQPDPWHVVPLGQMLAARFTPPTKWSTINPRLFWLPVSGWVGVVPTGNYGDSPVQYAADYSGRRVIPLLEAYPRAVSPDGTMAATIGKDGHVKIRRLEKWWLPPAAAEQDSGPNPSSGPHDR